MFTVHVVLNGDVYRQVLRWSERVHHWRLGLHWQTGHREATAILLRHRPYLHADEGKERRVSSATASADLVISGLSNLCCIKCKFCMTDCQKLETH